MEDNSSRLHSGESDGGAGRVYDWEDFLCSREVSGGEEESVYLARVLTCLSGILSSAPSAPLDGPLAGGLRASLFVSWPIGDSRFLPLSRRVAATEGEVEEKG